VTRVDWSAIGEFIIMNNPDESPERIGHLTAEADADIMNLPYNVAPDLKEYRGEQIRRVSAARSELRRLAGLTARLYTGGELPEELSPSEGMRSLREAGYNAW